jgi:hypothetical protein
MKESYGKYLTAIGCFGVLGLSIGGAKHAPQPSADSFKASVRVTDKVLNRVNPHIFGDNIEWVNQGDGCVAGRREEVR